ncbi:unnamed protein product, partial [Heterotrigona itama]
MKVQMYQMDRVQVTLPNYSYVLNFEKNFVHAESQALIKDHFPICFYYCAIYILLVFGGCRYMSNRTKFEPRGLLTLWSITFHTQSTYMWSLVMNIYHHEITRIRRHCFHRVPEAAIDISTLVTIMYQFFFIHGSR